MKKIISLYISLAFVLQGFSQIENNTAHDFFQEAAGVDVFFDNRNSERSETLNNIHQPPSEAPGPDDRIIFWLHGLGGDTGSWNNASSHVSTNYGLASVSPTYTEFSLASAGSYLHYNHLVPQGLPIMQLYDIEDPKSNFIIAHSQGGLVARATEKFYIDTDMSEEERMFGGIVTFGSPHGGALLINNLDAAFGFINDGCEAIQAGPLREKIENSFLLDIVNQYFVDIYDFSNQLCSMLTDLILPNVLSDFTAPITNDYQVGAAALAELNTINTDMPKVAFHGEEEDPVLWRTVYYFAHDPNSFGLFGANDDQPAVNAAAENELSYEMKYITYLDKFANACDLCWDQKDEYLFIANGYREGLDWFRAADDSWKMLIGAAELQPIGTDYICLCATEDYNGNIIKMDQSVVDEIDDCCCNTDLTTCTIVGSIDGVNEFVAFPNDGVIPASSAMAFPGADKGPDNAMMGSNHQQMRNDQRTEEKLMELLAGLHGNYFKS